MGDDLNFDMSGMRIFMGGKELKEVHEITVPPDVKLSDADINQIGKMPIHAIPQPKEFVCEMKLRPTRRPRRWQIERAYKLMGTTVMREFWRAAVQKAFSKGSHVIVKAHANMGKSDAPLEIVGYVENIEGGKEHETLLHFASVHGE
ncbi:MAG: hypothetical protein IJ521_05015 [Schwartzia sp.]|nr:hypothetical protein [Schwartzia sp. (in: firmicutes)]